VDGRVAVLGDRADPARSSITVDGVPVAADPALRYYALNKPRGVTTTLNDPHARRTLAEFLPKGPRLFPVGRLDRDSEGLLLLTNDGRLANRIQHPRFGVEKEYLAEVSGHPAKGVPHRLISGVRLDDGPARAVAAKLIGTKGGTAALRLVMVEGRKREVRRMMDAVGHPVVRLVRTRIGPLKLGQLRAGEVRQLAPDEVRALFEAASGTRRRRA
jgi:23S rRNA pseudouridine2605 synthase